MTHVHRQGFTLLELLMSMAIGLVVVNAAFVCFFFARKAMVKAENLGSQVSLQHSMMQWTATTGSISDFPVGKQSGTFGRSDDPLYIANQEFRVLGRKIARLQIKDYAATANAIQSPPPLYFACLEQQP